MRLAALDRKLLRDLLAMKGQAAAIGLVLAAGVAMFVAYLSNFDSLLRTQAAYYDRHRFAEVFASCKRAPRRLEERIREIPGVAPVSTRVVADVTLDVPGFSEPVKGRLIAIPAEGRPVLNDLFIRQGRWIEPGRADEVLVNEAFALAHHLSPGSTLRRRCINGRRRTLRVAGLALSPEYVYVIPPGEVIPDDKRFGVVWMERRALATAFDMEGGFNDVALDLMPGASVPEVIARLDHLLEPWGGRGAIPRAPAALPLGPRQRAAAAPELRLPRARDLPGGGRVPPERGHGPHPRRAAPADRRPQGPGLREREDRLALPEVGLAIAAVGALVGIAVGAWLGAGMIGLYNQYFRFPVLLYRLSGGVALSALAIGLGAAALGAAFAVRRAVGIPPAEAMRPEPPARYRPSFVERPALRRRLSHATRMVLRNLERQPYALAGHHPRDRLRRGHPALRLRVPGRHAPPGRPAVLARAAPGRDRHASRSRPRRAPFTR